MTSPIGRLLEHYGAKRVPSGKGWKKINCPFHGDKHASAAVNHDLNVFNCFACDVAGDVYKIIMIQEGVNFREAKSRAEEVVGTSDIPLPKSNTLGRRVSNKQGTISGRRKDISPGSSIRANRGT
jgi:DNA primase